MSAEGRRRDLVVLQSFRTPRPTTNPYIVMLGESLSATSGLEMRNFGWRTALRGGYDVFHLHWPEVLIRGTSPLKSAVRQALTLSILVLARLRRVAIVRTVHNLELPDGISRRERALLELAERWTTLRIRLNDDTPERYDTPYATIPHGHYREWFARFPRPASRRGRLAYAGLIRRYKGVETLVEAFIGTDRPPVAERPETDGLSLHVAGNPSSSDLADALVGSAAADPRISLDLRFLSEADFARAMSESELVVLPYRFMHNSGSVLAALSLERPVLVPDNAVNTALAEEVGSGWIHTFAGELTADDLVTALADARDADRRAPDLSRRDWDAAGRLHLAAYRAAMAARRHRSRETAR